MKKAALVSALVLALSAGAAQAATVIVSFTDGNWKDAVHCSFLQYSNPTPISHDDHSTVVKVWGWQGNVSGFTSVTWFDSDMAGLLDFGGYGVYGATGQQAFGNTTAAPVFTPGVFTGLEYYTHRAVTVTIAYVPSAAPEPAVWTMLIAGFALLGMAVRHRRAVPASI